MINSIKLVNFRSYKNKTFKFTPELNVVTGPNGSGKTNLLESILFVCKGKSYRAKDEELINHESDNSLIHANFDYEDRKVFLSRDIQPFKKWEINSKEYRRLSNQKQKPVVIFQPLDLLLLTGGPNRRREFIDDLIENLDSNYGVINRHYKRVLSQRNHLLRSGRLLKKQDMFIWNLRLTELGGKVAAERHKAIESLNRHVNKYYQSISNDNKNVRIEYKLTWPLESYETKFIHNLEQDIERDTLLGHTSSGPHREDIAFYFNNHKLNTIASRGESKTVLLALKMAETNLIKSIYSFQPIFLLDDVFSELDKIRRNELMKFIEGYQTIITSTDADIAKLKVNNKNIIKLT
jgi:DNA replication and repair protein RecF